MTRRDLFYKWLFYATGLLPVWILEGAVLNRVPVFGVAPMLLPIAAVSVGVLEGVTGGAVFGLFVGVLSDAVYPGAAGGMTIGLTIAGLLSGAAAEFALRHRYLCCLLCSAGMLTAMDTLRVLRRLFAGMASLPALLSVAVPEVLWSLVFTLPVYGIFKAIRTRVAYYEF